MKSTITSIHPAGSTVARQNGTEVKVGDDVTIGEALTLTMPAGSKGSAVAIMGPARPAIAERVALPIVEEPRRVSFAVEGTKASTPIVFGPALTVGDVAARGRPLHVTRAADLPALKIE
jgi:hypothetical protein